MKSRDLGKLGTGAGLSLVAIAAALAGAACSNSGGDGSNMNGVITAGIGGAGIGAMPLPRPPGAAGGPAIGVGGASGPAAGGGGVKPAAGSGGAAAPVAGAMATGGAGAGDATNAGAGGATAGSGGMAGGGEAGTTSTTGGCLDGLTGYDKDGPFKFKAENSGAINFWVPMVPAGCKVPVIHLANGTGASCASYGPALERMASWGFLTTCYEDPNTGAGDQGVMAIDTAFKNYPDLADMKIGSTGHSQGGQASFTVLSLAEAKWGDKAIYAGLAMEPASGFGSQPIGTSWQALYAAIKSPMFMFSGVGTDGLVSQGWVQQAFDALDPKEEAYFWAKNGATHIPVPNGEEQEISIPWFRWKLLGDNDACKYFKAIPMTNTAWVVADTKNEVPCK